MEKNNYEKLRELTSLIFKVYAFDLSFRLYTTDTKFISLIWLRSRGVCNEHWTSVEAITDIEVKAERDVDAFSYDYQTSSMSIENLLNSVEIDWKRFYEDFENRCDFSMLSRFSTREYMNVNTYINIHNLLKRFTCND